MKFLRRKLFLIFLLGCLSIIPTFAHGYLVRAIPANRASLQHPPTRLQYWFSEALEPRFSEMNLRDASGMIIASGAVDEVNRTLLTLQVPSNLQDGAYIVELRPAFASDGHVVAESRVFFVGDVVGSVEAQLADDSAVPLEVVWRALLLLANILMFGVTALYALVLYPAWGSASYPAGGLPPRVMIRLKKTLLFAIVLAMISNLLALLQQSMTFFSVDPVQVISQNLWQVVLIGSRFGDVWTFRMVLLAFASVLLFASHYYSDTMPNFVRGFWVALAWLTALIIGVNTVISHSAGSLLLPWLAMLVNWLHSVAVAFWIGGIIALVLILPVALAPYDGDARRQALMAVMSRFSRLVVGMVALVIVTGIYNALNWFVSPADLATTYGGALGLKLLMVALLLFVAGLHHLALHPQLAQGIKSRLSSGLGGRFENIILRVSNFGASLRLEMIFAILVLSAVALLSATPIPQPEILQVDVETPTATQTINDYSITTSVIPGGLGINSYDTVIEQADKPIDDVTVFVQMIQAQDGKRGDWNVSEQVESGLYVAAGDEIDRVGQWWTLIDVLDKDGNITRAVFEWDIDEDATILIARDPQLIHLLAIVAILVVIGWLAYPSIKRFYVYLHVTPLSALIAFGIIIGSMLLLWFSAGVVAEQERQYQLTINPPPEIINTVLPSAESLARGTDLYQAHCPAWENESRDFDLLFKQSHLLRDDEVYQITLKGWRNLAPCDEALSTNDRWHIVNYLRTLEARNTG